MRESLLGWQQYRYLKWGLALLLLSIALYVTQGGSNAAQPPNGGTWQGYSCQYTDLVELTADGPKTVARFQSAYSNKGAVTDDGTDISVRIADVAPGKSFTVNFTPMVIPG